MDASDNKTTGVGAAASEEASVATDPVVNEEGVKILTEAEAAALQMSPEDKEKIKVPSDLTKVSNARAKELVEAGAVEDRDLPGKMFKRKQDGFVARIPNYIYDAYSEVHKDEWDEIKLVSDPDA